MKILSGLLALIISGSAWANVVIKIPTNINILAANEQHAHLGGGFFASKKTLTLPNGTNQIVFRFQPYFTENKDRVIIESHVVIAKFTASDKELNFVLPHYRNSMTAKREINQFKWQLIDKKENAVSYKSDILIKEGVQFGRDYPREAKDYNQTLGIAAINNNKNANTAMAQQPAPQKMLTPQAIETQLHYWYQQADKATQQRFKAYINQQ